MSDKPENAAPVEQGAETTNVEAELRPLQTITPADNQTYKAMVETRQQDARDNLPRTLITDNQVSINKFGEQAKIPEGEAGKPTEQEMSRAFRELTRDRLEAGKTPAQIKQEFDRVLGNVPPKQNPNGWSVEVGENGQLQLKKAPAERPLMIINKSDVAGPGETETKTQTGARHAEKFDSIDPTTPKGQQQLEAYLTQSLPHVLKGMSPQAQEQFLQGLQDRAKEAGHTFTVEQDGTFKFQHRDGGTPVEGDFTENNRPADRVGRSDSEIPRNLNEAQKAAFTDLVNSIENRQFNSPQELSEAVRKAMTDNGMSVIKQNEFVQGLDKAIKESLGPEFSIHRNRNDGSISIRADVGKGEFVQLPREMKFDNARDYIKDITDIRAGTDTNSRNLLGDPTSPDSLGNRIARNFESMPADQRDNYLMGINNALRSAGDGRQLTVNAQGKLELKSASATEQTAVYGERTEDSTGVPDVIKDAKARAEFPALSDRLLNATGENREQVISDIDQATRNLPKSERSAFIQALNQQMKDSGVDFKIRDTGSGANAKLEINQVLKLPVMNLNDLSAMPDREVTVPKSIEGDPAKVQEFREMMTALANSGLSPTTLETLRGKIDPKASPDYLEHINSFLQQSDTTRNLQFAKGADGIELRVKSDGAGRERFDRVPPGLTDQQIKDFGNAIQLLGNRSSEFNPQKALAGADGPGAALARIYDSLPESARAPFLKAANEAIAKTYGSGNTLKAPETGKGLELHKGSTRLDSYSADSGYVIPKFDTGDGTAAVDALRAYAAEIETAQNPDVLSLKINGENVKIDVPPTLRGPENAAQRAVFEQQVKAIADMGPPADPKLALAQLGRDIAKTYGTMVGPKAAEYLAGINQALGKAFKESFFSPSGNGTDLDLKYYNRVVGDLGWSTHQTTFKPTNENEFRVGDNLISPPEALTTPEARAQFAKQITDLASAASGDLAAFKDLLSKGRIGPELSKIYGSLTSDADKAKFLEQVNKALSDAGVILDVTADSTGLDFNSFRGSLDRYTFGELPPNLPENEAADFRRFNQAIKDGNLSSIGFELANKINSLSEPMRTAYIEKLNEQIRQQMGPDHGLRFNTTDNKLELAKAWDTGIGGTPVQQFETGQLGKDIERLKKDFNIDLPSTSDSRREATKILLAVEALKAAGTDSASQTQAVTNALRDLSGVRLDDATRRAIESSVPGLTLGENSIKLGDTNLQLRKIDSKEYVLPGAMSQTDIDNFGRVLRSLNVSGGFNENAGRMVQELLAKLPDGPSRTKLIDAVNQALEYSNQTGQKLKPIDTPEGPRIVMSDNQGRQVLYDANGKEAPFDQQFKFLVGSNDSTALQRLFEKQPAEFKALMSSLVTQAGGSGPEAQQAKDQLVKLAGVGDLAGTNPIRDNLVNALKDSSIANVSDLAKELNLSPEALAQLQRRDVLKAFNIAPEKADAFMTAFNALKTGLESPDKATREAALKTFLSSAQVAGATTGDMKAMVTTLNAVKSQLGEKGSQYAFSADAEGRTLSVGAGSEQVSVNYNEMRRAELNQDVLRVMVNGREKEIAFSRELPATVKPLLEKLATATPENSLAILQEVADAYKSMPENQRALFVEALNSANRLSPDIATRFEAGGEELRVARLGGAVERSASLTDVIISPAIAADNSVVNVNRAIAEAKLREAGIPNDKQVEILKQLDGLGSGDPAVRQEAYRELLKQLAYAKIDPSQFSKIAEAFGNPRLTYNPETKTLQYDAPPVQNLRHVLSTPFAGMGIVRSFLVPAALDPKLVISMQNAFAGLSGDQGNIYNNMQPMQNALRTLNATDRELLIKEINRSLEFSKPMFGSPFRVTIDSNNIFKIENPSMFRTDPVVRELGPPVNYKAPVEILPTPDAAAVKRTELEGMGLTGLEPAKVEPVHTAIQAYKDALRTNGDIIGAYKALKGQLSDAQIAALVPHLNRDRGDGVVKLATDGKSLEIKFGDKTLSLPDGMTGAQIAELSTLVTSMRAATKDNVGPLPAQIKQFLDKFPEAMARTLVDKINATTIDGGVKLVLNGKQLEVKLGTERVGPILELVQPAPTSGDLIQKIADLAALGIKDVPIAKVDQVLRAVLKLKLDLANPQADIGQSLRVLKSLGLNEQQMKDAATAVNAGLGDTAIKVSADGKLILKVGEKTVTLPDTLSPALLQQLKKLSTELPGATETQAKEMAQRLKPILDALPAEARLQLLTQLNSLAPEENKGVKFTIDNGKLKVEFANKVIGQPTDLAQPPTDQPALPGDQNLTPKEAQLLEQYRKLIDGPPPLSPPRGGSFHHALVARAKQMGLTFPPGMLRALSVTLRDNAFAASGRKELHMSDKATITDAKLVELLRTFPPPGEVRPAAATDAPLGTIPETIKDETGFKAWLASAPGAISVRDALASNNPQDRLNLARNLARIGLNEFTVGDKKFKIDAAADGKVTLTLAGTPDKPVARGTFAGNTFTNDATITPGDSLNGINFKDVKITIAGAEVAKRPDATVAATSVESTAAINAGADLFINPKFDPANPGEIPTKLGALLSTLPVGERANAAAQIREKLKALATSTNNPELGKIIISIDPKTNMLSLTRAVERIAPHGGGRTTEFKLIGQPVQLTDKAATVAAAATPIDRAAMERDLPKMGIPIDANAEQRYRAILALKSSLDGNGFAAAFKGLKALNLSAEQMTKVATELNTGRGDDKPIRLSADGSSLAIRYAPGKDFAVPPGLNDKQIVDLGRLIVGLPTATGDKAPAVKEIFKSVIEQLPMGDRKPFAERLNALSGEKGFKFEVTPEGTSLQVKFNKTANGDAIALGAQRPEQLEQPAATVTMPEMNEAQRAQLELLRKLTASGPLSPPRGGSFYQAIQQRAKAMGLNLSHEQILPLARMLNKQFMVNGSVKSKDSTVALTGDANGDARLARVVLGEKVPLIGAPTDVPGSRTELPANASPEQVKAWLRTDAGATTIRKAFASANPQESLKMARILSQAGIDKFTAKSPTGQEVTFTIKQEKAGNRTTVTIGTMDGTTDKPILRGTFAPKGAFTLDQMVLAQTFRAWNAYDWNKTPIKMDGVDIKQAPESTTVAPAREVTPVEAKAYLTQLGITEADDAKAVALRNQIETAKQDIKTGKVDSVRDLLKELQRNPQPPGRTVTAEGLTEIVKQMNTLAGTTVGALRINPADRSLQLRVGTGNTEADFKSFGNNLSNEVVQNIATLAKTNPELAKFKLDLVNLPENAERTAKVKALLDQFNMDPVKMNLALIETMKALRPANMSMSDFAKQYGDKLLSGKGSKFYYHESTNDFRVVMRNDSGGKVGDFDIGASNLTTTDNTAPLINREVLARTLDSLNIPKDVQANIYNKMDALRNATDEASRLAAYKALLTNLKYAGVNPDKFTDIAGAFNNQNVLRFNDATKTLMMPGNPDINLRHVKAGNGYTVDFFAPGKLTEAQSEDFAKYMRAVRNGDIKTTLPQMVEQLKLLSESDRKMYVGEINRALVANSGNRAFLMGLDGTKLKVTNPGTFWGSSPIEYALGDAVAATSTAPDVPLDTVERRNTALTGMSEIEQKAVTDGVALFKLFNPANAEATVTQMRALLDAVPANRRKDVLAEIRRLSAANSALNNVTFMIARDGTRFSLGRAA